jgi:hypothetical protein
MSNTSSFSTTCELGQLMIRECAALRALRSWTGRMKAKRGRSKQWPSMSRTNQSSSIASMTWRCWRRGLLGGGWGCGGRQNSTRHPLMMGLAVVLDAWALLIVMGQKHMCMDVLSTLPSRPSRDRREPWNSREVAVSVTNRKVERYREALRDFPQGPGRFLSKFRTGRRRSTHSYSL